ncbi:MAG: RrF2 family transcriptional regulator [Collinsella intestinalis]
MLISSKGRYALKLMIYIAAIGGDPVGESISADAVSCEALAPRPQTKVSLREVAEREGISLKYLEQLVRPLMNAGLLRSVRGKGGGYVLAKPAADVRAGDILRAAEGERSTVARGAMGCARSDLCSTVKFWTGLEETIDAYVDGVTLAELAHVPEIKVNIEL